MKAFGFLSFGHYAIPGQQGPDARTVLRQALELARFADEFNLPFGSTDSFATQIERVNAACRTIDRDPGELCHSAALVACVGQTEAEFVERARRIGRAPDELRGAGLCGLPDEVRAGIDRWTAAGADRIYFQLLDVDDLEHVALLAEIISAG